MAEDPGPRRGARARSNSAPARPAGMLDIARRITSAMRPDPKFHIKGSMAALVHGGHVEPGDIDMVVGSFPQANRALGALGYPRVTPFQPRIQHPPQGLPPVDVLHSNDWGADHVGRVKRKGVRVTDVLTTIRDLKRDPRQEKRARNARLVGEIIRANTREAPF